MILDGWLALRLLMASSDLYRRDGYVVEAPPPYADFDFIALRGGERVLVCILGSGHSRPTVASENDGSQFPSIDAREARLDVVWQPVTSLPSIDMIDERLQRVRHGPSRQDRESTFLLLMAALEASILRVGVATDRPLPEKLEASRIISALYEDGLIAAEHFATAQRAYRLRNQIAHGNFAAATALTEADIGAVFELARSLLSSIPSRAAALLDDAIKSTTIEPFRLHPFREIESWIVRAQVSDNVREFALRSLGALSSPDDSPATD